MTGAAIDTTALVKMLYTSLAACITVAVIFSTALLGAIRATDMRRANRTAAALAYGALAVAGLAVAAAIVIYGITLLARKG
jgi:hypothetical protein